MSDDKQGYYVPVSAVKDAFGALIGAVFRLENGDMVAPMVHTAEQQILQQQVFIAGNQND